MRLPRAARMLRPGDFAALRTNATRLTTISFVAEYRHNVGDTARLGMAVSRRVSKRAVVRNRIRRLIREEFRLHRSLLPHFDILLIARVAAAQRSNRELHSDLGVIWHKLTALKETHSPGTMRADS